jgi:hypothetical protein
MMPEYCIFCRFFYLNPGEPDYSEITPGESPSMGCSRGLWRLDPYEDTEVEYRQKIQMARSCDLFEEAES